MQAPELAVEEMKRAAIDLKMPGFQIGSHVGDWNLDAKELYPIYKTAEELGETMYFRFRQWWFIYEILRETKNDTTIMILLL